MKQIARIEGEPFASIGLGRITLNSEACKLLKNIYDYEYVEVKSGKEGGRLSKIGLKFISEKTLNCLRVSERKYKGKIIGGLNINSKALVSEFFGKTKDNNTTRYAVEKVDEDMLAINIVKEL